MQILKEEEYFLFKKIREKEALEEKLISPDKFFNNTPKRAKSTLIIVCSVVFKLILEVMKVRDSL